MDERGKYGDGPIRAQPDVLVLTISNSTVAKGDQGTNDELVHQWWNYSITGWFAIATLLFQEGLTVGSGSAENHLEVGVLAKASANGLKESLARSE